MEREYNVSTKNMITKQRKSQIKNREKYNETRRIKNRSNQYERVGANYHYKTPLPESEVK